jgi:hypothetical protein
LSEEEQGLISGPCLGTVSCRQEVGWDYQGGDIPTGDGINNVTAPAKTVKDCCIACQGMPSCGAYTYAPSIQMCYFKVGWVGVSAGCVECTWHQSCFRSSAATT